MCIRDSAHERRGLVGVGHLHADREEPGHLVHLGLDQLGGCLLYTSDAADERSSVDLGGRRIIKKKTR